VSVVFKDGLTADVLPSSSQTCPYCLLYPLIDGKCQRCGTLCRRCGTPYLGAYCPRCWGEGTGEEDWTQAALGSAAPTPFGDSAPTRWDLKTILDHSASRKEHNIARGIHVDYRDKAIHDRVSAAVEQLDASHEVRARIMEGVEREAAALWRRARKDGGKGISLEKAVALAFLGQCRGIGRSVEEIQGALARAGFRIPLESACITVSTEGPLLPKLFVNGRERIVKMAAYPRVTRVPLYLSDLREGDDIVEIQVAGGAIVTIRSSYEYHRRDWQTVEVFAGRRCFYLFKALKEAAVHEVTASASASSVNVDALIKRYQPSKFPITATLMEEAGCLRKVELRFASLLRNMIVDARGRAPESVAASALYLADMDTFRTLPAEAKSQAWSSIVRRGLASGGYLGVKGLLLKDEVGFDESVVRDDDLRWIGMVTIR
jgi:hypothetical protein